MAYEAYSGVFDGVETRVLRDSNADLEISVLPSFGANMISVKYRGVEVMRKPETMAQLTSEPNRYGNPVLMPPNRIWEGVCEFEGRRYEFPLSDSTGRHHIHGLVKAAPWRVDRHGADDRGAHLSVSISSKGNASIWRAMPIDFVLFLDFVVTDGVVSFTARAENRDKVNMPFGIGFHPYFKSPLAGPGSQSQCFVKCPASMRWELDECFPTGKLIPVEGEHDLKDWKCLEGLRLDDIYSGLPLDGGGYHVAFEDRGEGIGLEFIASSEYPHWVLFTGTEGAHFICLEPQSMVTNSFNLDLPRELTGMRILGPGESFSGPVRLRPYQV